MSSTALNEFDTPALNCLFSSQLAGLYSSIEVEKRRGLSINLGSATIQSRKLKVATIQSRKFKVKFNP